MGNREQVAQNTVNCVDIFSIFLIVIIQLWGRCHFANTSFTSKTDLHDITEILLKVALNTITLTLTNTLLHLYT